MLAGAYRWVDRNIFSLGRELRLSYLPPLMVYLAYGISGLTGTRNGRRPIGGSSAAACCSWPSPWA